MDVLSSSLVSKMKILISVEISMSRYVIHRQTCAQTLSIGLIKGLNRKKQGSVFWQFKIIVLRTLSPYHLNFRNAPDLELC
ncbi:MAG: hypothetical protein ACJAZK_001564 [Psychroserpens sp.]|jgi:hypothetical protein